MYNIDGLDSVLDVMAYTVKAMKEVGYDSTDIDDYIVDAIKQSNYRLLAISADKLEECNSLLRKPYAKDLDYTYNWDDEEDTWRNSYYSSLWDDDGRYDDDFLNGYKYWHDGNVVDDVQTLDEEKEAYEGFSTCKNYYWDSSEDENGIDAEDLATAEEFKPSYDDIVYDPWAEEDTK